MKHDDKTGTVTTTIQEVAYYNMFLTEAILVGRALVANSLLSRAGEAYDARDRGPNRKSRFKSTFNI
jgi:hypothetical protein